MAERGDRELYGCLETHGTRPPTLWEIVGALAESVLSLAPFHRCGLEDIPLRQRATRKLQESYRQAYIYFAINDGKIARCSEQVV